MNLFQLIILISLTGNVAVGLFVVLSNPKRRVNKSFFTLSFLIALWLGSMFFCSLQTHKPAHLLFWIRQTSAFGGWLPVGIFLLQISILHGEIPIRQTAIRLRYWILAAVAITILCHSPFFVLSAESPSALEPVPPTRYGWGFILFIAYFLFAITHLTFHLPRLAKSCTPTKKSELQFLQIGCYAGLVFGVALLVFAEIMDQQAISLFLPFSALFLDGFVAYGIATRRILSASSVFQKVVAVVLMIIYLTWIYSITAWVAQHLTHWFFDDPSFISYLIASLAVAFSVVPAHGKMQAVARQLFPYGSSLDANAVSTKASQLFQKVLSEDELSEKFASLLSETFETDCALILLPTDLDAFSQHYPLPAKGPPPMKLQKNSPLITLLEKEQNPVTPDLLTRSRATGITLRAGKMIDSFNMEAIAGGFVRNQIKVVILLPQRLSGKIYDLHDQSILQILCDRFAVALDNSALYTAVQNGKIYNEILLDSLTSGVIAVDSNRTVTVINQQAQILTGLSESTAGHQPISVLPDTLASALETVLNTKTGFRDQDMVIEQENRSVSLRVSGSLFRSHTGHLLGALLVFNDMSEIRKMEEQLRRTDRLSSIGTLSAGMAHEIKNPLVTIKTFTQLLPEQYRNEEFRRTFFRLVDQEVQRIDDIIGRFLTFSRPAKAALRPTSLHRMIEDTLQLVTPRLVQNNIEVDLKLHAERSVVNADAGQINQALINLLLNAMDSMSGGGRLTVQTRIDRRALPDSSSGSITPRLFLVLEIQDTGCGIEPDNLGRIFDPFYTTKDHGVGLGLSVSHGILQEHHALVEVESEPERGSVFRILFPIEQQGGEGLINE